MKLAISLTFVLLAGCSVPQPGEGHANIYPIGVFGQRIVGNDAYVTVSNVWNEMDAMPLADRHCRQYGKSARFTHMIGARAVYDCVKP